MLALLILAAFVLVPSSPTPLNLTTVFQSVPEVVVTGDRVVTLELGESWVDPGATCTDAEDGTLPVTLPPLLNTLYDAEVNLEYTCTDSEGNLGTDYRHVMVIDTTPPVLTLAGLNPISIAQSSTWTEPGVTCQDPVRGHTYTYAPEFVIDVYYVTEHRGTSLTETEVYYTAEGHTTSLNAIDVSRPGTYSVNYTCTDYGQNTARATRIVYVMDSVAPTLALRGLATVTVLVGESWDDPGASCTDSLDGDLPVTATGGPPRGQPLTVAVYSITYRCLDAAGNAGAELLRTVQVAAAARAWLVLPLAPVSAASGWEVQALTFYADDQCTRRLDTRPRRVARREPNGAVLSLPGGSGASADGMLRPWSARGNAGLGRGWTTGRPCDVSGDHVCGFGFEFATPTQVGCVTLTQGTAPGTYATGLRLQWRQDGVRSQAGDSALPNPTNSSLFRDFVRIERHLTGGHVSLARTCPSACADVYGVCDGTSLTVHPCAGV